MLVMLAAAVLCAPSRSTAGCSRYAEPATPHASSDLLDPMTLPGDAAGLPAPRKPAIPCDGPSCSGRPAAPATSPVVPRLDRAERWGCLTTVVARDEASVRLLPPPEARRCAVRHGLRIDRPPRPSGHPCA